VSDDLPENLTRPADHDARMAVMRRAAGYYLGDESWAGELIAAYLYPRYVADELDDEQAVSR
jgi:hypothetical protein